MPLNLRPHSVNTFAISKLMYRCNTIDLRIGDIKVFNKVVKSFLYADLIEKPDELTLYRDIDNGGLGLVNIQSRARASLISTFLQTAINPEFSRNHYHNFLYRYFVLEESLPKPDIPPNFSGDFFSNNKEDENGLNFPRKLRLEGGIQIPNSRRITGPRPPKPKQRF